MVLQELVAAQKNGWFLSLMLAYQGPIVAIAIAALTLERKGLFEPGRVRAKHTAAMAATVLILQMTTWLLLLPTLFSGNVCYDLCRGN